MILIRLLPGRSRTGKPVLIPIPDEIEVAETEINGFALTVEVDEKQLTIQRGWDDKKNENPKF